MKLVRCPACGVLVEWATSEWRPFCSERCRLVDLESWASERYAIPGDPVPQADDGPQPTKLIAVPNYTRLNRGGWSQVWITENPKKTATAREGT